MALYTVRFTRVCTGGEHITVTIRQDGVPLRQFGWTRTELQEITLEDALKGLMWFEAKKARATTPAQIKTAVEAASWEVPV